MHIIYVGDVPATHAGPCSSDAQDSEAFKGYAHGRLAPLSNCAAVAGAAPGVEEADEASGDGFLRVSGSI